MVVRHTSQQVIESSGSQLGRTPLYHLTHMENLANLLDRRALYCDDLARADGLLSREIGDPSIKSDRRRLEVDIGPGGRLSEYVPFYFAPRSPMLRKLARGQSGYTEGQDTLFYLVTTVERVVAPRAEWVFTDHHASNPRRSFHADLRHLDRIDWELMRSRVFNDTDADPDRKQRRCAEFDVRRSVPLDAFDLVVTRTPDVADQIEAALREAAVRIPVEAHRDDEWFFAEYP